jgi:hypothetical protein
LSTDASDPLVVPLLEVVVGLCGEIEDVLDDHGEPRELFKALEWVAAVLSDLPEEHRARLADIVYRMADARPPSAERDYLEEFPSSVGLVDDDDD